MDVTFTLKSNDQLTQAQIQEIEAARDWPHAEDEDNPELDPQATPELWESALKALAERNRRMAKRMA